MATLPPKQNIFTHSVYYIDEFNSTCLKFGNHVEDACMNVSFSIHMHTTTLRVSQILQIAETSASELSPSNNLDN